MCCSYVIRCSRALVSTSARAPRTSAHLQSLCPVPPQATHSNIAGQHHHATLQLRAASVARLNDHYCNQHPSLTPPECCNTRASVMYQSPRAVGPLPLHRLGCGRCARWRRRPIAVRGDALIERCHDVRGGGAAARVAAHALMHDRRKALWAVRVAARVVVPHIYCALHPAAQPLLSTHSHHVAPVRAACCSCATQARSCMERRTCIARQRGSFMPHNKEQAHASRACAPGGQAHAKRQYTSCLLNSGDTELKRKMPLHA